MKRHELRLTGSGGQGLILAGIILAEAGLHDGKEVIQSQSYGPEARGGASRSEVIISTEKINYPKVDDCDIMLALTQDATDKYIKSLKSNGVLIIDRSVKNIPDRDDITIYNIPILETASKELNKPMVANIIALGSIIELTDIVTQESLEKAVLARVPRGTEDLNRKALKKGVELMKNYGEGSYGEIC